MVRMIVSVSRRTDIPAFYGEWFLARLAAGFCFVRNPFDPRQVSRVSLERDDVDALVLWTRDPRPFADGFDALDRRGFPYVVLLTLTGYGRPLEPHAPAEAEAVVAARSLAERIGPDRLVWRYDPVVLGPGLDHERHATRFAALASRLEGSSREVKVSFLDLYRKTRRRLGGLGHGERYLVDPALGPAAGELLARMSASAAGCGMRLTTCAEAQDWSAWGAPPGACVDGELLQRLFGLRVGGRDRGQRPHCRCAPSRDIGAPDTCLHGCVYCYATASQELAAARHSAHDPHAPALVACADLPRGVVGGDG